MDEEYSPYRILAPLQGQFGTQALNNHQRLRSIINFVDRDVKNFDEYCESFKLQLRPKIHNIYTSHSCNTSITSVPQLQVAKRASQ